MELLQGDDDTDNVPTDFMRKVVAILRVLSEEAVMTAKRFMRACGRSVVAPNDMRYALMFEAHEFFLKDIDASFMQAYQEEAEHTYETSSSAGSDENSSISSETDDEVVEGAVEDSTACVCDAEFHGRVMSYVDAWELWEPDDDIQRLIKSSIDSIPLSVSE